MIIYRECPICRSNDLEGYAIDLYRPGPHISRTRCRSCGMVFANPMAEEQDLQDFYQGYYEKPIFVKINHKEIIQQRLDEIKVMDRGLIGKEAPQFSLINGTGRFLDIGCGLGTGLAYAQKLGFELYATEFDPVAIDFVTSNFTVSVHNGDLITAHYPTDYFDFVHISHVIEHVLDPIGYLAEMHRILKPGGILAMGTPDISNSLYRFYRWSKLFSLKVPLIIDGVEHTFVFPKNVLADLCRKQGFDIKLHYAEGLGEKIGNLLRYDLPIKNKISRILQNFFRINQWIICEKRL